MNFEDRKYMVENRVLVAVYEGDLYVTRYRHQHTEKHAGFTVGGTREILSKLMESGYTDFDVANPMATPEGKETSKYCLLMLVCDTFGEDWPGHVRCRDKNAMDATGHGSRMHVYWGKSSGVLKEDWVSGVTFYDDKTHMLDSDPELQEKLMELPGVKRGVYGVYQVNDDKFDWEYSLNAMALYSHLKVAQKASHFVGIGREARRILWNQCTGDNNVTDAEIITRVMNRSRSDLINEYGSDAGQALRNACYSRKPKLEYGFGIHGQIEYMLKSVDSTGGADVDSREYLTVELRAVDPSRRWRYAGKGVQSLSGYYGVDLSGLKPAERWRFACDSHRYNPELLSLITAKGIAIDRDTRERLSRGEDFHFGYFEALENLAIRLVRMGAEFVHSSPNKVRFAFRREDWSLSSALAVVKEQARLCCDIFSDINILMDVWTAKQLPDAWSHFD